MLLLKQSVLSTNNFVRIRNNICFEFVFKYNCLNWSLFYKSFERSKTFLIIKLINTYILEEDFVPVKSKRRMKAPAMIHKPTKKQRWVDSCLAILFV